MGEQISVSRSLRRGSMTELLKKGVESSVV